MQAIVNSESESKKVLTYLANMWDKDASIALALPQTNLGRRQGPADYSYFERESDKMDLIDKVLRVLIQVCMFEVSIANKAHYMFEQEYDPNETNPHSKFSARKFLDPPSKSNSMLVKSIIPTVRGWPLVGKMYESYHATGDGFRYSWEQPLKSDTAVRLDIQKLKTHVKQEEPLLLPASAA